MFARARVITALLLAATLSNCSCETEGINRSSGILAVSTGAVEFGTGCLNDTITRELLVENTGGSTLQIESITIAGEVEFAFLEALPTELPPRSESVIRIGFTPSAARDFVGVFKIVTNADKNPEKSVTLTGKGFNGERTDFQVLCERIPGSGDFAEECAFLTFDDVLTGTTRDRVLRLENRGCATINVHETFVASDAQGNEGDEDLFSFVGPSAPFDLRGESSQDLTVRFAPVVGGEPYARLRIRTSDTKVLDTQLPPGEWDLGLISTAVAPALLVEPDRITWFDTAAGTSRRKTIRVANTGNAALTVDSITIAAEGGTTDFVIDPADAPPFTLGPTGLGTDSREVGVIYTPTGVGTDRAIATVNAGSESKGVELVGGVEPLLTVVWLDGTIETAPPVKFGTVAPGTKDTRRTVRLKNEGNAALSITAVSIVEDEGDGEPFRLAAPFTATSIPPANHVDVDVIFDDVVTRRDDAGLLRIASNDPVSTNGEKLVGLESKNEPNIRPVPSIVVCARNGPNNTCTTGGQVNRALELDASGSTGPEATDVLTYEWVLGAKPAGSTARIENVTAAQTRIISDAGAFPDVIGSYAVRLTVRDQFGNANDLRQTVQVR